MGKKCCGTVIQSLAVKDSNSLSFCFHILEIHMKFTGIHPTPSPEPSSGCCSVGKIICIESCDTGAAMVYSELYEEYEMQVQNHNGKTYYQSRDGKHALSWQESGVWNLGTADQLGTAWAWSKDNVSCPYEITNWEYWDSNSQVQKADGTLEFDCITSSGGF